MWEINHFLDTLILVPYYLMQRHDIFEYPLFLSPTLPLSSSHLSVDISLYFTWLRLEQDILHEWDLP